MPSIFKTIASIIIWILFINGCLGLILSAVNRLSGGQPLPSLTAWLVAITSLILAVIAIKVRHAIE